MMEYRWRVLVTWSLAASGYAECVCRRTWHQFCQDRVWEYYEDLDCIEDSEC